MNVNGNSVEFKVNSFFNFVVVIAQFCVCFFKLSNFVIFFVECGQCFGFDSVS